MAQTSSLERFPTQVPRPAKRTAGATGVGLTPLNVRAGKRVTLDDATREHVHARMARQLGKLAVLVERSTVRFDDINGKRGGIDVSCSINVMITGRPSVVVEERAATVRAAFDAAAATAARAVRRVVGRADMSARPSRARGRGKKVQREEQVESPEPNAPPEEGSLIGRRVGKARANLERAAARPEKHRRDSLVDTAQPGVRSQGWRRVDGAPQYQEEPRRPHLGARRLGAGDALAQVHTRQRRPRQARRQPPAARDAQAPFVQGTRAPQHHQAVVGTATVT
jgi:putative sigma-54 modulation protein